MKNNIHMWYFSFYVERKNFNKQSKIVPKIFIIGSIFKIFISRAEKLKCSRVKFDFINLKPETTAALTCICEGSARGAVSAIGRKFVFTSTRVRHFINIAEEYQYQFRLIFLD